MDLSENFLKWNAFKAKWEGGTANVEGDTGGLTRFGLTYGTYNGICQQVRGITPSQEDFDSLTLDDVTAFANWFWVQSGADRITSLKIAVFAAELFWSGEGDGSKILQKCLDTDFGDTLTVDGGIGDASIAAINAADADELFGTMIVRYMAFEEHRIAAYERMCVLQNNPGLSQEKFVEGWANRLVDMVETFID